MPSSYPGSPGDYLSAQGIDDEHDFYPTPALRPRKHAFVPAFLQRCPAGMLPPGPHYVAMLPNAGHVAGRGLSAEAALDDAYGNASMRYRPYVRYDERASGERFAHTLPVAETEGWIAYDGRCEEIGRYFEEADAKRAAQRASFVAYACTQRLYQLLLTGTDDTSAKIPKLLPNGLYDIDGAEPIAN